MKVLVTGGSGFLGRAVVDRLLARGDAVRSLARGDAPDLRARGVDVRLGDIGDEEAVDEAVRGVDAVIHVAAKAGVWGPAADYRRANVEGTAHVVAACLAHKVERLVQTSTPSVVFHGGDLENIDESVPHADHFLAAYPATKAEAERHVLASNGPKLATVSLRPHLIWGPGDNHLLPRLWARARLGQLRRVGNRPNLVDAVYVDNAADAHLLALDRLHPGSPIAGRPFFIANGEPIPLWTLVDLLLAAADLPPLRRSISPSIAYGIGWTLEQIHHLFRLPSEPRMTRFLARELATSHHFDLTAARRDLGYHPSVSTSEGLLRLAAWARSL